MTKRKALTEAQRLWGAYGSAYCFHETLRSAPTTDFTTLWRPVWAVPGNSNEQLNRLKSYCNL